MELTSSRHLKTKPWTVQSPCFGFSTKPLTNVELPCETVTGRCWPNLALGIHSTVTTAEEAEVKAAELSDFQIFKITEDVGESSDLSASNPEKLAELKQRLKTHYQELVNDSYVWPAKKPAVKKNLGE